MRPSFKKYVVDAAIYLRLGTIVLLPVKRFVMFPFFLFNLPFLTFTYLKETKEVQPVDRIEDWMIKIFPKSKDIVLKAAELNDQDNISNDAIESRIINIGLTIAMVISLVIFGQIIQIYVMPTNQQIIVERKLPDIKNAFGKYLKR